MELAVYGAICPEGGERRTAYRLLELALAREAGVTSLPEIKRTAMGKPFFPDRNDLCFNISHSRGCAACALHDLPVGVDVERLRAAPRRLAQGMEDGEFFRLWTMKEASIKRDGLSVALLRRPFTPNSLCQSLPSLLPGCAAAVCPSAPAVPRLTVLEYGNLWLT